MAHYVFKRILWMIPTFLGITILTFVLIKMAPESQTNLTAMRHTSQMQLSTFNFDTIPNASELKQSNNVLKLKLLPYQRKVNEYLAWLDHLVRFDFGYSVKDGQSVSQKIMRALPSTLFINLLSLIFIFSVSVPLGLWTAKHEGEKLEKVIMLKLFLMYSLPGFWIAHLMIVYLAGADHLNLFPLGGFHSFGYEHMTMGQKIIDTIWHVFLPVVAMSLTSIAFMTRFTHESVRDILKKAFIRTAYAKGLKPQRIWIHHILRNALIAFVTLFGTLLPSLLGGSVIIEKMFSIPGMGALAFESALSRDYNMIMALTALSAFITLVAMLLQDLLYVLLDPRIHFSKENA